MLRQARSQPILADLKAYLERERAQVLPKSPIGQAIAYTLSNWDAYRHASFSAGRQAPLSEHLKHKLSNPSQS